MTPTYSQLKKRAKVRKSVPRAHNSSIAKSLSGKREGGKRPKVRKAWKRKPSEALRIYGTKAFRDFLHATPCLGCGHDGRIQQAHFGKHPMSKKLGWERSGPMCGTPFLSVASCHDRLDRRRQPFFTVAQRAVLEDRLAEFHNAWQDHLRENAA